MSNYVGIPLHDNEVKVIFPNKCVYCDQPKAEDIPVRVSRTTSRQRASLSIPVPYCAKHAQETRKIRLTIILVLLLCISFTCSLQMGISLALHIKNTAVLFLIGPALALALAVGMAYLVRSILNRRIKSFRDMSNGLGIAIAIGINQIGFEFSIAKTAEEFAKINGVEDTIPGLLSKKQLDDIAQRAIDRTLAAHVLLNPPVVNSFFYGATNIDPKHLTIWLAFKDANALQNAKKKGLDVVLRDELSKALQEEGYPVERWSPDKIGFVSEEEVNQAGGPWTYFH